MKKYKKLVTLFLAAAMALSLAACSSGKAAGKITGIYLSPAQLSYINMRPEYNYYLTTFTQQEITLMDDNTYCLEVSAATFSLLWSWLRAPVTLRATSARTPSPSSTAPIPPR